ncbi:MAG: hypothetical protein M5U34_20350 [Chloroflexi bacterium]|nr:hypothetical protein [Chloroflexota bacterium]
MVAGLIHGFTQGLDWIESVKYGVAAGTANTLTLGAGRFSRPDFDHVFNSLPDLAASVRELRVYLKSNLMAF